MRMRMFNQSNLNDQQQYYTSFKELENENFV